MTNDDTAADDAPFVQTHPLPANIDPEIITGMAHAHELRVVKIRTWVITLEGREADQSALADRLVQNFLNETGHRLYQENKQPGRDKNCNRYRET